jgi:hypothetical protein
LLCRFFKGQRKSRNQQDKAIKNRKRNQNNLNVGIKIQRDLIQSLSQVHHRY